MPAPEKLLHIDIPVKLSDVKVVFSVDALAFEGGSARFDLSHAAHQERHRDDIPRTSAT